MERISDRFCLWALIFGKQAVVSISESLLLELFSILSNDYDEGLETVRRIEDATVRRTMLSQFKRCYIKSGGSEDMTVLLADAKPDDKNTLRRYDQVLLKMIRKHDGDMSSISKELKLLPAASKQRHKTHQSHEFQLSRKIGLLRMANIDGETKAVIRPWHWFLIFVFTSLIIIKFSE